MKHYLCKYNLNNCREQGNCGWTYYFHFWPKSDLKAHRKWLLAHKIKKKKSLGTPCLIPVDRNALLFYFILFYFIFCIYCLDDNTFGLRANCALAVFGLCNDWKGTTRAVKMQTTSEMFEIKCSNKGKQEGYTGMCCNSVAVWVE